VVSQLLFRDSRKKMMHDRSFRSLTIGESYDVGYEWWRIALAREGLRVPAELDIRQGLGGAGRDDGALHGALRR
jgi:hypothetical protein